jgi:hypothetical protein
MVTVKLFSKGQIIIPKTIVNEVRGFLSKYKHALPSDTDIQANIKAKLKAQDVASKE